MIPRYTTPEMQAIWAPENKFKHWLDIEVAAATAMEENGSIPKGTAKAIRAANINIDRIEASSTNVPHCQHYATITAGIFENL